MSATHTNLNLLIHQALNGIILFMGSTESQFTQAIFGGRFQYYLVLVCIPGCLADKAVSFRLALLEHESSHIVSIEWDPMALKLH